LHGIVPPVVFKSLNAPIGAILLPQAAILLALPLVQGTKKGNDSFNGIRNY